MKYWPISSLIANPVTPPTLADDLDLYRRTGQIQYPDMFFTACKQLVSCTRPTVSDRLVFVNTVGAPARRQYIGYPTETEFEALERAVIFEQAATGNLILQFDAMN